MRQTDRRLRLAGPLGTGLLLVMAALACALPLGGTQAPPAGQPPVVPVTAVLLPTADQPAAPAQSELRAASADGVSFSYDPAIASDVTARTVPAEVYTDAPPWANIPAHLRFDFVGYQHPSGETFHQPNIAIYNIAEFEAANELAVGTIAEQRDLLSAKPASPESIPFLPVFNAAQMILTQVSYVDFQNGSGVRFVTQYGQAISPINNHDVFYTYQGITSDGTQYVAAILPVSNAVLLPTGDEPPGGDWDAFGATFETYIADVRTQLNAQPADSFSPSLDALDAMMRSLTVQ